MFLKRTKQDFFFFSVCYFCGGAKNIPFKGLQSVLIRMVQDRPLATNCLYI